MILFEYIQYFVQYILRDPFTQLSWFLAMITILIAYFQKDDYTVKKLMLLSALFWGTHFYLLGVYSWLAAVVIWVFRLILSIKFEKSFKAFILIVCVTLITGFFTFDGILSLLPVLTSLTWAYSFFFLEKVKLRLAMLFNSSTWLVYHISIGSVSGIMNEVFTQVILIATVYRMMHPEGGTHYYANKIKNIIWKRKRVDYDRYIFLHDRIINYKQKLGSNVANIINLDLRSVFNKKKKYDFLHKVKN